MKYTKKERKKIIWLMPIEYANTCVNQITGMDPDFKQFRSAQDSRELTRDERRERAKLSFLRGYVTILNAHIKNREKKLKKQIQQGSYENTD
jgi:hypothetical protein